MTAEVDLKGLSKDAKEKVQAWAAAYRDKAEAKIAASREKWAQKLNKSTALMEAGEVAAASVAGSVGGAALQATLENKGSKLANYGDIGPGLVCGGVAIVFEKQLGKTATRVMLGAAAGALEYGLGRMVAKRIKSQGSAEAAVAGHDEEEVDE